MKTLIVIERPGWVASLILVILALALQAHANTAERYTALSTTYPGYDFGDSHRASISEDGSRLVFQSETDVFSLLDTNGARDDYFCDRTTGECRMLSNSPRDGVPIGWPCISSDGRYAMFWRRSGDKWLVVCQDLNTREELIINQDETTGAINSARAFGMADDGSAFAFEGENDSGLFVRKRGSAGTIVASATRGFDLYAEPGITVTSGGTHVLFATAADILPSHVGNLDVYLYDTALDSVVLVSSNSSGEDGDGSCYSSGMSSDRRLAVFYSASSNMVPGISGNRSDVYLKNMMTGHVTSLTSPAAGLASDAGASFVRISADGRFAFFSSSSTNLGAAAISNICLYRKDLSTGDIMAVQHNPAAGSHFGADERFGIIRNPDQVLYWARPEMLQQFERKQIFVAKLSTGTTTRITPMQRLYAERGTFIRVSDDGSKVVYIMKASHYDPARSSENYVVVLYDRDNGQRNVLFETIGLSQYWSNLQLSKDGRFLLYTYVDTLSSTSKGYRLEIASGVSERVDEAAGVSSNGNSFTGNMSGNGRYIVFLSNATNLMPDRRPSKYGYLKDMDTDEVRRVIPTEKGTPSGRDSLNICDDGSRVLISTTAALVPGVTAGAHRLYIHDLGNDSTELVTVSNSGVAGQAWSGLMTNNGSQVVFYGWIPDSQSGLFIRDTSARSTRLIVGSDPMLDSGAIIRASEDGRFIVYGSVSNQVAWWKATLIDLTTGIKYNFPFSEPGAAAPDCISADGRFIGVIGSAPRETSEAHQVGTALLRESFPGSLVGHLRISTWAGPAARPRARFLLYGTEGDELLDFLYTTQLLPVSGDGTIRVELFDHRINLAYIQGPGFLTRRVPGPITICPGDPETFDVNLIMGDLSGDDVINAEDYVEFYRSFGSTPGDSNWNQLADLDGDEEIGPADFGVLSANFGMAGDRLP